MEMVTMVSNKVTKEIFVRDVLVLHRKWRFL